MKTVTYKYGNITVNVIDPCTDEAERRKRLEEAVRKFFIAIEKGKQNEKENQMVERINCNVPSNNINATGSNTNAEQMG